jgi:hypothetical protein
MTGDVIASTATGILDWSMIKPLPPSPTRNERPVNN